LADFVYTPVHCVDYYFPFTTVGTGTQPYLYACLTILFSDGHHVDFPWSPCGSGQVS